MLKCLIGKPNNILPQATTIKLHDNVMADHDFNQFTGNMSIMEITEYLQYIHLYLVTSNMSSNHINRQLPKTR